MTNTADRLAGKWRIVETSAWDRAHFDLVGPAFISVVEKGHGEMAFGALEASLDCGFTPDGIDFVWNGADEGDQVCGGGWATFAKTATSKAKSSYHNGDETTFIASPWKAFSAAC